MASRKRPADDDLPATKSQKVKVDSHGDSDDDTISPTRVSAVHAVLNTFELLEAILIHLDVKQLLHAQRVSHLLRDTIANSTPLQQKLFKKFATLDQAEKIGGMMEQHHVEMFGDHENRILNAFLVSNYLVTPRPATIYGYGVPALMLVLSSSAQLALRAGEDLGSLGSMHLYHGAPLNVRLIHTANHSTRTPSLYGYASSIYDGDHSVEPGHAEIQTFKSLVDAVEKCFEGKYGKSIDWQNSTFALSACKETKIGDMEWSGSFESG